MAKHRKKRSHPQSRPNLDASDQRQMSIARILNRLEEKDLDSLMMSEGDFLDENLNQKLQASSSNPHTPIHDAIAVSICASSTSPPSQHQQFESLYPKSTATTPLSTVPKPKSIAPNLQTTTPSHSPAIANSNLLPSHARPQTQQRESSLNLIAEESKIASADEANLPRRARRIKSGLNLRFIPPDEIDGQRFVRLTEDGFEADRRRFQYALVGFVAGLNPSIAQLQKFVADNWGLQEEIEVLPYTNGFVVFNFKSEDDCLSVLEDPYWSFGIRPLLLKRWSPDIKLEKSEWRQLHLWVKFPGLHPNLWTEESLSRLGSYLGSPICTDQFTASKERISFPRVLIDMDISKPFPSEISSFRLNGENFVQKVEYDWKPKFCGFCERAGHVDSECRRQQDLAAVSSHPTPNPLEAKTVSTPPAPQQAWIPKRQGQVSQHAQPAVRPTGNLPSGPSLFPCHPVLPAAPMSVVLSPAWRHDYVNPSTSQNYLHSMTNGELPECSSRSCQ